MSRLRTKAAPAAAAPAASSRAGTTWHRHQLSLALLNVVGGTAVLGSYLLAFSYSPELRAGLWGDVPMMLRPVYTTCMFVAAAGYFPLTYLLLFRVSPDDPLPVRRMPYRLVHVLYALVLVPSALWLPLTARMLASPSVSLWWLIRFDLALVAIGTTGLLVVVSAIAWRRRGLTASLAVAGALPLWFQTTILDALIWPVFFPTP